MKRLGQAAQRSMSNARAFKKVTDTKLEDMSKTILKKRTEAKMMWGYHTYNE